MPGIKLLDDRQVVNRAILQQLFPYVGEQTLDILMASINADLTAPLNVTASNPASLVVNIGTTIVSNPESNRNRSLTFVNGVIPEILSPVTVTFPSTSGGNIVTPDTTVVLTLPSGDYVQVLLTIDSLSRIGATVGTPNAVLSSLVVPKPDAGLLAFAYVTLQNISGIIQNVSQANIYQIAGPESAPLSNLGYIAKNTALSSGTTQLSVNFSTPMADLSYVVLAMMENDVDPAPQYQQVEVTSKTLSGFTFEWNAPLATSNYSVNYIIPPISIPGTEKAISNGATTVTLPISQTSPNYGAVGLIQNLVDSDPQFQTAIATSQSSGTVVDSFNAPTETGNYQLVYITSPVAQIPIGSGVTSITATLPVAYGSAGYAVVASLSNLTDINPLFQPLVIINKSSSTFTIGFNVATPTDKYVMTYFAISLTA